MDGLQIDMKNAGVITSQEDYLLLEEINLSDVEFDENGSLQFKTEALDADAMYDEIGSVLRIKKLQTEKRELLESLEMYYRVFFLGETIEDDGENVDKGN